MISQTRWWRAKRNAKKPIDHLAIKSQIKLQVVMFASQEQSFIRLIIEHPPRCTPQNTKTRYTARHNSSRLDFYSTIVHFTNLISSSTHHASPHYFCHKAPPIKSQTQQRFIPPSVNDSATTSTHQTSLLTYQRNSSWHPRFHGIIY